MQYITQLTYSFETNKTKPKKRKKKYATPKRRPNDDVRVNVYVAFEKWTLEIN